MTTGGRRVDELVEATCDSNDLRELEEASIEPLQQAVIVTEQTWRILRDLRNRRELERNWAHIGDKTLWEVWHRIGELQTIIEKRDKPDPPPNDRTVILGPRN